MGNSKKFQSYAEKLRHPNWQKKRLEVLNDADFTCQSCRDTESTLHVHHKWYLKGREPWEYDSDQLAVLCDPCHADAHIDMSLLSYVISKIPTAGQNYITQGDVPYILAGIFGIDIDRPIEHHQFLFKFGVRAEQQFVYDLIARHEAIKGGTNGS